jgi:hypothetical protein
MPKKVWIALALDREENQPRDSMPLPTSGKQTLKTPSRSPDYLSNDWFPDALNMTSPQPVSTEKTSILPIAVPDRRVSIGETSGGHRPLVSGMEDLISHSQYSNMVGSSDLSPKFPHDEPVDKTSSLEHPELFNEASSGGISNLKPPRPLDMALSDEDFDGDALRSEGANISSPMKGRYWSSNMGREESSQGVPKEEYIASPWPNAEFGNAKLYCPPNQRAVKWHWTCCEVCVIAPPL